MLAVADESSGGLADDDHGPLRPFFVAVWRLTPNAAVLIRPGARARPGGAGAGAVT